MYAIETKGLTKSFGPVKAVDNFDLRVPFGSIFGFLGPNGAGKTTTLKMLMGFTTPTSGESFILGENLTNAGDYKKNVGYLPDVPAFYNWMRADEYLTFSGELLGMERSVLKTKVGELLEVAGLVNVKTRIGGFSRGMKQRLGIVQALINDPKVVILDEPTSALDPIGRKEVMDMISHFAGRSTVLLSTHILADVERVCDTVAIIDKGKLIIEKPIKSLKEEYIQQVISLEILGDKDDFVQKIKTFKWVEEVQIENGGLRILVTHLETAQHTIPKVVAEMGFGLKTFQVKETTLEDIFVRLVKANED